MNNILELEALTTCGLVADRWNDSSGVVRLLNTVRRAIQRLVISPHERPSTAEWWTPITSLNIGTQRLFSGFKAVLVPKAQTHLQVSLTAV